MAKWQKGDPNMKLSTKIFVCIMVIVLTLSLLCLGGCVRFNYKETGEAIECGFIPKECEVYSELLFCAVKSSVNVFDIDNVTLDFYIGGESVDETAKSILLYVTDWDGPGDRLEAKKYKTTTGYYLLGEMSADEFNNGPSDVSILVGYKGSSDTLRFLRRYTLPVDLFDKESGKILIMIGVLPKIDETVDEENYENRYYDDDWRRPSPKTPKVVARRTMILLEYTILDDGKVQIIDPTWYK